MSHGDRSDRIANGRDLPVREDAPSRAAQGTGARPAAPSRPAGAGPSRADTADPADIDRYIDERAQATPRVRGAALPATPRSGGRVAPNADDPTDPAQWEEFAPDADQPGGPPAVPGANQPGSPVKRPARPPARARARSGQPRAAPTLPKPRVPAFIASGDLVHDQVALALLGVAGFGLAVMAALLSNQIGSLPQTIAIHLDPAGMPDRWASRGDLWRIPLLVVMTTLMNLVVAWFLSATDRFASRFLLASSLVVQLIAWVALFDFM